MPEFHPIAADNKPIRASAAELLVVALMLKLNLTELDVEIAPLPDDIAIRLSASTTHVRVTLEKDEANAEQG